MKAVKKHKDCAWVIPYIERWLKAPFQMKNGDIVERTSGTPQGGVISPVLANLFMHYTFDKWMGIEHPKNSWARYADDAVIHCRTKEEAEQLLEKLKRGSLNANLNCIRRKLGLSTAKMMIVRGIIPSSNLISWDIPFDQKGRRTDMVNSSTILRQQ